MAYMVGIFCDGCKDGCVGVWENFTVNKTTAIRRAREEGWSVGKTGWFCPKCRRRGVAKKETTGNHSAGTDTIPAKENICEKPS